MNHLRIIEPPDATGALADVYTRMMSRPVPAVYRPTHGGVAGIIRAHSLDAGLIPCVFGLSSGVNQAGPLTWAQRELVASITSRLNQCFY
jgi:hypothetical protein